MMYTAVVHVVLLYVSEIWVVTGVMMKVLEGFHNSISRRIVGMMAWRGDGGEMGVGLGGCGAVGDRDFSDEVVGLLVAGTNVGICIMEDDLQNVYRRGEN